jgi:hypothetical protein
LRGIMEPPDERKKEIYSGEVQSGIWIGFVWPVKLELGSTYAELKNKAIRYWDNIDACVAPSHYLTSIRTRPDGRSTSPRKELKRNILCWCYGIVGLEWKMISIGEINISIWDGRIHAPLITPILTQTPIHIACINSNLFRVASLQSQDRWTALGHCIFFAIQQWDIHAIRIRYSRLRKFCPLSFSKLNVVVNDEVFNLALIS